jgi:hypothetical protein
MLEVGGDSDPGEEALGPDDRGELQMDDLECDQTVVLGVARQIDRQCGGHLVGHGCTLIGGASNVGSGIPNG